ncbi:MAG: hypothetical protein H6R18_927 [Proteobacteria bacterium]|nr:hypothetical protein [Pseudomonadota bacterium]
MHGSLLQFLGTEDGAARVLAHAELLLRLSRRYETIVPAGLGHVSRVANFKSGVVIIHADNGAAAAKLRQMSTSLCQLLAKDFCECNGIEIKVQPRKTPAQSIPSKPQPLSDKVKDCLQGTLQGLPEKSPLRAALEKLRNS